MICGCQAKGDKSHVQQTGTYALIVFWKIEFASLVEGKRTDKFFPLETRVYYNKTQIHNNMYSLNV